MNEISAPASADPRAAIGALLSRVKLAITAEVDDALLRDTELAAFEVTAAQFIILKNLHFGNTECAGDLCKTMSYDRGAMSRMLDRLESKGLIRRVRRPGERRTIALEITTEGEQLFPKMSDCVDEVVKRFFLGLSATELRQLEAGLQKMLSNAKG
jgi:DNA-binding MarR family transcriptional regulator